MQNYNCQEEKVHIWLNTLHVAEMSNLGRDLNRKLQAVESYFLTYELPQEKWKLRFILYNLRVNRYIAFLLSI